ncbi:vacuolar protein sorting 52A [Guillardia theta CCMP2712]|uniref:Vacuolar protein sorting 52A n=2 Tax=Guillardia theta TaxID=55529 RepID=L1JT92_GUITC|nr:vacuolar protein sorting 52A [Guillardia theta CCMP2712]EKX51662.1 vacuolar protein sorting 52A [Guillardia theta CCMP2712]|eukprot:XP_005838642.1 vacuolar protein sorting 52A [Guillardia theta CCMP2712]
MVMEGDPSDSILEAHLEDQPGFTSDDKEVMDILNDPDSIKEELVRYGDDDVIGDALKVGGGDLWQYAQKLEADLRQTEAESIEDYVRQSSGVAELRLHIEACDEMLKTFEDVLTTCQSELGGMGNTIMDMKRRANSLEVLANNRKSAEQRLAALIDGIAMPPGLARAIHEGEINDGMIEHLQTLEAKLSFLDPHLNKGRVAVDHVKPLLDRLKSKAVDRLRDHLLRKIRSLDSDHPFLHTFNLSHSQGSSAIKKQHQEGQDKLRKDCAFVKFLLDHHEEVYREVMSKYFETMGGILSAHFRSEFRVRQSSIREVIRADHRLIDISEVKSRFPSRLIPDKLKSFHFRSERGQSDHSTFSLGGRLDHIMQYVECDEEEGVSSPPELVLQAIMQNLVDMVLSEHEFASSLFPRRSKEMYAKLLSQTLEVIKEGVSVMVKSCVDPIAILLMIYCVQVAQSKISEKMNVAEEAGAAEEEDIFQDFFLQFSMLVWPRFKHAVQLQMDSVRSASLHALTSRSSTKDVHVLTLRFAELSSALLDIQTRLNANSVQMAKATNKYMIKELEKVVKEMKNAMGSGLQGNFFAFNQFDHILQAYYEIGLPAQSCLPLRMLLDEQTNVLIPAVLGKRFLELSAEMKRYLQVEEGEGEGGEPSLTKEKAKEILDAFTRGWKEEFVRLKRLLQDNIARVENEFLLAKKAFMHMHLIVTRFLKTVNDMYEVELLPNSTSDIEQNLFQQFEEIFKLEEEDAGI